MQILKMERGWNANPIHYNLFTKMDPPSNISRFFWTCLPIAACCNVQEAAADLSCQECQERFCRPCSASVHRRGRLREHTLLPCRGGASEGGDVSGGGPSGAERADGEGRRKCLSQ